MRSMTGFGQASGRDARHAVAVTLRAENHRFLDLRIRLDPAYRASEPRLREVLAGCLFRGRVEVGVEIRPLVETQATVTVHQGVVQAIHGAVQELVQQGLVAGELTAADLFALPGVVQLELGTAEWTDEDEALLLAVASQALEELVAARTLEGEKLGQALEERLSALEVVLQELQGLRPAALAEIREGLRERLEELLREQTVDPGRLEQEIAFLVDRSDIREEGDRLAAHLDHFRTVLGQPGAVGKRLDFLLQEMFRELNTLGAKCRNATMVQAVLEAKLLCEQLREQVQNVE